MQSHLKAHFEQGIPVVRVPPAGDGAQVNLVAGDVNLLIHTGKGPGLLRGFEAEGEAHQGQVTCSEHRAYPRHSEQVFGRGGRDDLGEGLFGEVNGLFELEVKLELSLKERGQEFSHRFRRQEGIEGQLVDVVGPLGAAAEVVGVEEFSYALGAKLTDLIGVGAMLDEEAQGLALEGFGTDEGLRGSEFGMGTLEAGDVDECSWPESVNGAEDGDGEGGQLLGVVSEVGHRLLEQEGGRGRRGDRVSKVLGQEVGHSVQVNGVGFAFTRGAGLS